MREKIDYSNMSIGDDIFGVLDLIDCILAIECSHIEKIGDCIYCDKHLFNELEFNPTLENLTSAVAELVRVADDEEVYVDKAVWEYISDDDNDYINYLENKYLV